MKVMKGLLKNSLLIGLTVCLAFLATGCAGGGSGFLGQNLEFTYANYNESTKTLYVEFRPSNQEAYIYADIDLIYGNEVRSVGSYTNGNPRRASADIYVGQIYWHSGTLPPYILRMGLRGVKANENYREFFATYIYESWSRRTYRYEGREVTRLPDGAELTYEELMEYEKALQADPTINEELRKTIPAQ